jgi:hypothetical protein
MIGQEWDSCLVEVYTTVKNPLVENFAYEWKNDMAANVATLSWKGVLWRSSFLGNLKASDKKLGLQRILTWIKYYPSMCCFQHFKVSFEGLGLVFKHFYMLQCIVSCSVLMTCLIPKELLSPVGTIERLGKFLQCQFHCTFLKLFLEVIECTTKFWRIYIYIFPLDL